MIDDHAGPLVTIITPTLNQAAYIGETLRSVGEQTYPRIEHIVIDGGSTDGTLDILREWGGRWISEPDGGQSDAINKGVAMASGKVCAWLNSDDVYLTPDAVSVVVGVMRAGARAVTAGGWHLEPDGTPLARIPVRSESLSARALRRFDDVLQPATFYETSLARELPLDPSLRWTFDWDFFIRLAHRTPIVPLEHAIAGYRIQPDAKTQTGGRRRELELARVQRRYSPWSPRLLLLQAIIAGRVAASFLPGALQAFVVRVVNKVGRELDARTGGIGIQP